MRFIIQYILLMLKTTCGWPLNSGSTGLMPSFLPPLIKFKTSLEVYENVRAVALSVVGILCEVVILFCLKLFTQLAYIGDWIFYIKNSFTLFVPDFTLKAREPTIIFWAIQNSVVEVCLFSILVGNELSKVVRNRLLYLSITFVFFYKKHK